MPEVGEELDCEFDLVLIVRKRIVFLGGTVYSESIMVPDPTIYELVRRLGQQYYIERSSHVAMKKEDVDRLLADTRRLKELRLRTECG